MGEEKSRDRKTVIYEALEMLKGMEMAGENPTCPSCGEPVDLVSLSRSDGISKIAKVVGNDVFRLNDFVDDVHENSINKGWWNDDAGRRIERNIGELLMLCVGELSEAMEEVRNGTPLAYYKCKNPDKCDVCVYGMGESCDVCGPDDEKCEYLDEKPEGLVVELIDCMIRIFDICGHYNVDVERILSEKHAYNLTRPYKHGGKKA